MGRIWEFLGKRIERGWVVAVFVLGLLVSPLLIRVGARVFDFLTSDGSDGPGLLSVRPLIWLLLIGSLVANWWLVRRVLRLQSQSNQLEQQVRNWQTLAGTPAPPAPPGATTK